jgi:hypothetical protein
MKNSGFVAYINGWAKVVLNKIDLKSKFVCDSVREWGKRMGFVDVTFLNITDGIQK